MKAVKKTLRGRVKKLISQARRRKGKRKLKRGNELIEKAKASNEANTAASKAKGGNEPDLTLRERSQLKRGFNRMRKGDEQLKKGRMNRWS